MSKIIKAAVSTKDAFTVTYEDGTKQSFPTDELLTKQVIEKVVPALSRGDKVTLDLDAEIINIYQFVEKQSKGVMKFFRVMKNALVGKELTEQLVASIALPMADLNITNEEETIVAVVQPVPEPALPLEPAPVQAEPVTITKADPNQQSTHIKTGIAPKQSTVIEGAEKLVHQVKHFSTQTSTEGLENFMRRVAVVASVRKHSAQELLDFLAKADLPIADDGSIIAYKRLRSNNKNKGSFVDSHTGTVTQRVGSRVFMDVEMVDPNRRNECSNGLHVGRRDYMRSFNGDAILILKIAPEDVVAVPQDYSGSKMRVCAYNIVAQVNQEGFNALVNNLPMTEDSEMAYQLTSIIKGNHTPVIETVEITRGKGIVITNVSGSEAEVIADAPALDATATKAMDVNSSPTEKSKVNKTANSPKVVKQNIAKITVEMTDDQKKAKKLWKKVQDGSMSKTKLAIECHTSTRSLDRWAEKFKF